MAPTKWVLLAYMFFSTACAEANSTAIVPEVDPDTTTSPPDTTVYSPPDSTGNLPGDSSSVFVFFTESFETDNFAQRGWYDNTSLTTSTTEKAHSGSQRSLEWRWNQGSVLPSFGGAARRKFDPTESVYISYWYKLSENWVGSGDDFHPHEIYLLTNKDGDWTGPASTRLTAYVEHVWRPAGGYPQVVFQDAQNINYSYLNQNAVGITEQRAAHGCNGIGDTHSSRVSCYSVGSGNYRNGRELRSVSPAWSNNSAADSYKSKWHFVEFFVKLNSIEEGVGIADGVVKYWMNGALIIDVNDILLRTALHSDMRFNQILLGPYIGSGSPATQSAWLDDLTVANGRPDGME